MSKATLSATIALAVSSLFIAGCATKNYVKQSIQPVDQKVDQVDKSSQARDQQQVSELNKTNQTVEDNEKKLSATTEVANTADTEAKGAMAKSNQNSRDLNDLRNVIANIDDYKPAGDVVVVHFRVNRDTISKDDLPKLDQVAQQVSSQPRYFITVEGFTDQTGAKDYNAALSRRRADQVISYLVGSQNIPVYRIHTVGLGDQKLIDDGKGRKAREESRRVEITVYTAKPLSASSTGGN